MRLPHACERDTIRPIPANHFSMGICARVSGLFDVRLKSGNSTGLPGKDFTMAIERTFVILKPDAVQRGLCGEIISRFERKGLKIIAGKFFLVSKELAEKHYGEHKGKPFYNGLVDFITKSPVFCLALEGAYAVSTARKLMGKTFGHEAEPGTIRGDFGSSKGMNLIHGSDSVESAKRELALWFRESELIEYGRQADFWTSNEEDQK